MIYDVLFIRVILLNGKSQTSIYVRWW